MIQQVAKRIAIGKVTTKRLGYWLVILAGLCGAFVPQAAFALNASQEMRWADYDILFYDPGDTGACMDASAGAAGVSPVSGAAYNRLKDAVRQYGEYAMEMQRQYGVPWEVVFAQMQKESGTGTTGWAVMGATNNWLGITGSGDMGSFVSPPNSDYPNGRNWAKYSSIEASISAWAGPKVLRNGYYDDAFPYLDPSNYNLEAFLREMISHYAPSDDGNDEAAYVASVLSFINGPIKEVREEMGWPSSAELARNEKIPVGGQNPVGSTTVAPSYGGVATCLGAGSGSITEAAIAFSWPGIGSHDKTDPQPAYREAISTVGLSNMGEPFSYGASCDVFVATVYRMTVDPEFYCCGTSYQRNYLVNSPLYTEIENLGNTSNLQSGDIFVHDGHIMLFVIDGGEGMMAHASLKERTGERGGMPFFSDKNGTYRIFRYTGGV